ncbi:MAG: aspartate--tRNA ligase [Lachnospirales bacterium]
MKLRTHNLSELRLENAGETVSLCGWLQNIRDKGVIMFITLRDFYGVTQFVVEDEKMQEIIRNVNRETTLNIVGEVVERKDKNPNMETGDIEVIPTHIEVLGECSEVLPFEIANSFETNEDLRLKYRFLDLRNDKVKNNMVLRSKVITTIRNEMTSKGFLEMQTPILTSSSPEGARDFIVPSRLNPGKFYALPQAPQQFKQLLMTSGFDKYFQIAPCFRDEDARADRSPGEFYQLDLEMAFATQDDVFEVLEEVLYNTFTAHTDKKVDTFPFVRIPYLETMEKYGSDKPDLRNPLIIERFNDIFENSTFGAFENKTIKGIVVKDPIKYTRKDLDKLTNNCKLNGANSLYYIKLDESNQFVTGISKFINDSEREALIKKYDLKANDLLFFIAEDEKIVSKQAGFLRTELGNLFDLLEKDVYRFCWIVDYPMFEENEETGQIDFSHNPFSMPQGGLEALLNKNPLDIFAYQYDIVCNGYELSSGAVRNHRPDIMLKAFEIAGYDESVVTSKFPALYNAFKYGAPPHAGSAPGIDRIVMLLAEEESIREVTLFPLNKNARDVLMNAPSEVFPKQLDDVHILIDESHLETNEEKEEK